MMNLWFLAKIAFWPFVWLYRGWVATKDDGDKWFAWFIGAVISILIVGFSLLGTSPGMVLHTLRFFLVTSLVIYLFGLPFAANYEMYHDNFTGHKSEPKPHALILIVTSSMINATVIATLFFLLL